MITYKDIDTAVLSTRMVIYGYLTEILNKAVDKCFNFNENALYISEHIGYPKKLFIKDNKIYLQNIGFNEEFEVSEMSVDELLILSSMVKDTETFIYYLDINNMDVKEIIDVECEIVE